MKRRLPVITAFSAALVLAACSSSTTDESPTAAEASTPAGTAAETPADASAASDPCAGEPTVGGTLTSARQNETLSLNPGNTPGGWGDGEAINLIHEGLVMLDPTGQTSDVVGAVADEWTVAPDGLSYEFRIRDGIKFSNGDPVTAEDIKYSLDRYADPERTQFASFAEGYKSTDIIDASTVRVNLTEPKGGFLYSLAFLSAAILPSKLVESQGDAFFDNPVGVGPFMLDSWNKGTSISFVRNPNYWNPDAPRLDKIVWNFAKDDNSRLLALSSGEAQTIDSVPWPQYETLRADESAVIDSFAIPSWVLLSVNHQKPQFDDPKVREAMNLAINRPAINEKIYSGLGEIPNSFLPNLRYDADDTAQPPFEYDVEKAKKLMAESGFPSGFSAVLEYPNASPTFAALAAVLQSSWAEIGVNVELRAEDQATRSKNFTGGTYDIMLPYALAVSDVPIPDEFAAFYAIPGGTNGFFSWWSDPAIEAQVKKFVSTVDETERASLWPQLQQAMTAQLPALNVLNLPLLKAREPNVCENLSNVIGYDTMRSTWLAK